MNRAVGAVLALSVAHLALGRAAPGTFPDDSPETAVACAVLGVSHPPGDPLGVLAGRLVLLLPAGSPAFRLNVAAAALAGLLAALLWRIARVLVPAAPAGGCALAALALVAANPVLAQQAGVPKGAVYVLNLALVAGVLLALIERRTCAAALLGGLLAGHHWMTFAALAPAGAVLVLRARRAVTGRGASVHGLLLALGASLWVFLPIRAAQRPAINWGDPSTAARFGAHVSRRVFLDREMNPAPRPLARQLGDGVRALAGQLHLPGIALVAAGGAALIRADPWAAVVLAATAASPLLAAAAYLDLSGEFAYLLRVFLLPAWLALAALGCAGAASWLAGPRVALRAAVPVLLLALPLFQAPALRQARPGASYWSHDIARALLDGLPGGAGLVTLGDLDTFPVWHRQSVEAVRRDVLVVNQVLLRHRWYREEIARAAGLPWLAREDDGERALRRLVGDGSRAWFSSPAPVPGLGPGWARSAHGLAFRLDDRPHPARVPRSYPSRGFLDAVRRLPDPVAELTAGFVVEAMRNLSGAPVR